MGAIISVNFFFLPLRLSIVDLKRCYFMFMLDISSALSPNNDFNIIFFGDSTSYFPPDTCTGRGDPDTHIPGLIKNFLSAEHSELKVGIADWSFAGAQMYNYYCMMFKAQAYSPDLVVIPINWLSFGEAWDPLEKQNETCVFLPAEEFSSNSESPFRSRNITRFQQLGYKAKMYILPFLGFRRSMREIFEAPKNDGTLPFQRRSNDRPFLRVAYPAYVHPKHEVCSFAAAISKLCSKSRMKVLFYISHVNHQRLQQLGLLDQQPFEQSKQLLVHLTNQRGISLVDLSLLLGDEYFFDDMNHYLLSGRIKIAQELAPEVDEVLDIE